jgi:hypothetical protein
VSVSKAVSLWSVRKLVGLTVVTVAGYRNVDTLLESVLHSAKRFFLSPILFAICTSAFSELCKNVYSGM